MGRSHEVEVKRLLVGFGAADRLVAWLGPVQADTHQVNHIFDTDDRSLDAARYAVRLRFQGGAALLTAKGPGRSVGANASAKLEAETSLEGADAQDVLAERCDPVAILQDRVSNPAFVELWRGLREARRGKPLRCWGCFENRRRSVPVTLPGGPTLKVEVDQTRFADGRVDEEIEIELAEESTVPMVEAWLDDVARRTAIVMRPSSPKIARFYATRPGALP